MSVVRSVPPTVASKDIGSAPSTVVLTGMKTGLYTRRGDMRAVHVLGCAYTQWLRRLRRFVCSNLSLEDCELI